MSKFYRGLGSLESNRRVEALTDRAAAAGEGTILAHPTLGEEASYEWGGFSEGAVRLAEISVLDDSAVDLILVGPDD